MSATAVAETIADADRRRVLTRATLKAADLLDIPQTVLARLLGVSAPQVSRMRQGAYLLDESRKEWELAALFLRMYRSLDSITVNEEARAWLNNRNRGLNGEKPLALITSAAGLVRVVDYLDAARARA
jgi:putative toxin-antitoxin system antitoxin component (TIGR02293 family)